MQTKIMSVKQWIAVPDNPIQRDTERHAARAKHLLTPLSIHAVVFAAQLPDGSLVKLDGHTRALVWSRNQVLHPPEVHCHLIQVKSLEEACVLYQTFDAKEALETQTDKVSGAFGQHHFYPESGLLKGGGVANALRLCWAVQRGMQMFHKELNYSIYSAINEFATELFALDSFRLKSTTWKSGLVAAFILTYRKHGPKVIPFWQAVASDAGVKMDRRMDGVQAITELLLARRGKGGGGSGVTDMAARCVTAVEKWLRGEDLLAQPRPYDLSGYITGARPAVILIKQKKAAPAKSAAA